MTAIRALDIRKGERWTPGRVAWHMAGATVAGQRQAIRKRRMCRAWHFLLGFTLVPTVCALALIVAWRVLRWGL